LISQQRPQDQSFSGLPQGGKVNLEKAGNAVILIKAQPVSIGNRDQKKIEKDFQGGKVSQEPPCNEAMIGPAERALDLSDSLGAEKFFDRHGGHPLFRMIPFSFGQSALSIWACISKQGKLLKRKVISWGWVWIEACISKKG